MEQNPCEGDLLMYNALQQHVNALTSVQLHAVGTYAEYGFGRLRLGRHILQNHPCNVHYQALLKDLRWKLY